MGSSYFGELTLGTGSTSSSRKGKKCNSGKPKQPQRGLGMAQLEKIRIQNEMASYIPSLHSPFNSNLDKMGIRVTERIDDGYGEFHCSNHSSRIAVTLNLLDPSMKNSVQKKRRLDWHQSTSSISENSDSNNIHELDLNLKLSL